MRILIFSILLLCTCCASAQIWDTTAHTSTSPFKQWVPQQQLDAYNLRQLDINKAGMYTLSAWGLGNVLYGAFATGFTHGEAQAFHASNTIWGSINFVIGLTGVISSYQIKHAEGLSFGATILHQHSEEKLFLINGALDFAYIGAGAAMWGFSDRLANQRTRNIFSGGGKSFLMQGGFLLLFDWSMYIAHSQHAYRNLNRYTSGLACTGEGMSYTLAF
jgi:hypothetical protein